MRRQGRDLFFPEPDPAGANREQADDALDDGGAPSPVASHQGHHLVGIDVDRHAAQDMRGASVGIDVVDLEQHRFCLAQAVRGTPSRMLATSLLARISSGVPSARNAPSCIMAMRSAERNTTSMSCSMTTAVTIPPRTTDDTVSMICVFSCVLTPLVGSSRNRSLGRSAYATATSRSLRSPCARPPAGTAALLASPN